jgi:hypothetical protein
MTVLIHGSGKVQSGIWARKLCLSEGLEQGSQLPYLQSLKEQKHSIVCTNTNQIFPKMDDPADRAADPVVHLADVMREVVKKSAARKFNFIGFSRGGDNLVNLLKCETAFFKTCVDNVILLDSAHDKDTRLPQQSADYLKKHAVEFITSKEPVGTLLSLKNAMSYVTKSSGTLDHDSVPYRSGPHVLEVINPTETTTNVTSKITSAFKALRGKGKAVAKDSGENNTSDESDDEVVVTGETKTARGPPVTSVSSASAPASTPTTASTAAPTTATGTANVPPAYVLDHMYPVKVFEVENFGLYAFKSNRETMNLSVGHSAIFQHPSGFELGVICTGNGVGLGFYDTAIEKTPPGGEEQLRRFVAATVSDHAHCTYGPIDPNEALVHLSALPPNETATSKCRELREKVIYKIHVEDRNIVGRYTTPQLLRGFRTRNVPLVCYERLPTEEGDEMIKCVTCKEQYHKDCVKDDTSAELIIKKFSCLACTIPYPGLTQGEGVVNTCPVDNTVTGLALQQSFNRQFVSTIPTKTPQYLQESIHHAIKNEGFESHIKYLNHYRTTETFKNNPQYEGLYGSVINIVYDDLCKGTFECTMTCSDGCPRNGKPYVGIPLLELGETWEVHSRIFDLEDRIITKKCDKCAYLIKKSPTIIKPDQEPLILPINFDQTDYSARFLADNLQQSLVVSDQHFDLCTIIVNQGKRNHYMAYMKHAPTGKWLAYDGLYYGPSQPKRRIPNHFRLAKTSDLCYQFSKVTSVEYYRNAEKTEQLASEKAWNAAIARDSD